MVLLRRLDGLELLHAFAQVVETHQDLLYLLHDFALLLLGVLDVAERLLLKVSLQEE